MSEDKNPASPSAEKAGGSEDEIERTMREAVASVERRERDEEPEDDPAGPGKTAAEAVTEAVLEAKNELETALEQTKEEATRLREKWLRAAADLENYRKRAARERDDAVKFGNERLLKDLLPVLDDLERAISAVESSSASDGQDQLLDGVRLVHKKFLGQLEKNGVTTFDSKGTPFDPSHHEAVQQVHSPASPGEVVEQLQRGFMLNERLLRPALVVVSLGPPAPAAAENK